MTQPTPGSGGPLRTWFVTHWQWAIGVVAIPVLVGLGVLIATLAGNNRANDEVRVRGLDAAQLTQVQQSGSQLDRAIAAYFDAIADAGLLQHGVSGAHIDPALTQRKATANLRETRGAALLAFRTHASDVQVLRSFMSAEDTREYFSALANVQGMLTREGNIDDTRSNVLVLGNLVASRNRLVDRARVRLQ